MSKLRLLLVGGGHAHLEILRQLILAERASQPAPLDGTLVSLESFHHYSGMAPGFLQGTYREDEIRFDLAALAARAGCRFVHGRADLWSPAAGDGDDAAGIVTLADGQELLYDLVSFNIGSVAAGSNAVAGDPRVALVKPISRILDLKTRLYALATADAATLTAGRHVLVVGGGAAGIELAFAAAAVFAHAGTERWQVTVAESRPEILPDYDDACRRRVEALLGARRIALRRGATIVGTDLLGVRLADGSAVAADLVLWLTGPEAPPLFAGSQLPRDGRGFLLVDDGLRSLGDSRVFAVGDCASLASAPDTPKAGVYAVRQAPILWRSLLAAATAAPPPRYVPQSGFLSLLNTADGRAVLRYRHLLVHSRWAWWLKDRIDRRFMRKYQRLELAGSVDRKVPAT
jgi:NADH dehydrogenase FAD-containing subunit